MHRIGDTIRTKTEAELLAEGWTVCPHHSTKLLSQDGNDYIYCGFTDKEYRIISINTSYIQVENPSWIVNIPILSIVATQTYIEASQLTPGMRIRTRRHDEMHEPEWFLDKASGGQYYVNYGKARIVPIEYIGQEYIVDTVQSTFGTLWVYQEYLGADGRLHQGTSSHIYDTLVAEILDDLSGPREPVCNCGKAKTGRQDMGPHSHWCNIPQGYTSRRS